MASSHGFLLLGLLDSLRQEPLKLFLRHLAAPFLILTNQLRAFELVDCAAEQNVLVLECLGLFKPGLCLRVCELQLRSLLLSLLLK